MPSPKKPTTLADWRKAQLAQLRGQLKRAEEQAWFYTKAADDLEALIDGLKKVKLKGRAAKKTDDKKPAKAKQTKPKKAKVHWTQTPKGKRKMAKAQKAVWKARKAAAESKGGA